MLQGTAKVYQQGDISFKTNLYEIPARSIESYNCILQPDQVLMQNIQRLMRKTQISPIIENVL